MYLGSPSLLTKVMVTFPRMLWGEWASSYVKVPVLFQWWIQGGGHPRHADPPPMDQIFMQFLGKFVCWCLPMEGWRPLLQGILDTPLYLYQELCMEIISNPRCYVLKQSLPFWEIPQLKSFPIDKPSLYGKQWYSALKYKEIDEGRPEWRKTVCAIWISR